MKVTPCAIADVLLIEPAVFDDERGWFMESFNARKFSDLTGLDLSFVQDNQSFSQKGVVRGLHYQIQQPQGKLVRAVLGEIFDVAVDIRRQSPTFGQSVGIVLSAANRRQLWVPPGFAHGFLVLSEGAEVLYKTTEYYAPAFERTLLWNDPALGIHWPDVEAVILSAKDRTGQRLVDAEVFA